MPCDCLGSHKGVQEEGGIPHMGRNMFQIPYQSITPRREQVKNLLVPVCLSASHVGISAIRLEPTWMIIAESAGIAAALAAERGVPVQDVPYNALRDALIGANQVLDNDVSLETMSQESSSISTDSTISASGDNLGTFWWDGTYCDT